MTPPERAPVVARPVRGTPRFRRNCWIGVIDGALVASDRKKRRYEFPLDASDLAPRRHLMLIPRAAGPWEHHYMDGRGESVAVVTNSLRWDGVMDVGEAAQLEFTNAQVAPPLRGDCVKLEDSTWAEMENVRAALVTVTVMHALGKFGVLDAFLWAFVAFGLLGYTVVALFSGVHIVPARQERGTRRRERRGWPGGRNLRKRRKRRLRRGG